MNFIKLKPLYGNYINDSTFLIMLRSAASNNFALLIHHNKKLKNESLH